MKAKDERNRILKQIRKNNRKIWLITVAGWFKIPVVIVSAIALGIYYTPGLRNGRVTLNDIQDDLEGAFSVWVDIASIGLYTGIIIYYIILWRT